MPSHNDEVALAEEIRGAEERLHIHDGLTRALEDPHAVLDVVASAADAAGAVSALRDRFDLDEVQALAVMDLQFRRATRRDRRMIERSRQEAADHLASLRALHHG